MHLFGCFNYTIPDRTPLIHPFSTEWCHHTHYEPSVHELSSALTSSLLEIYKYTLAYCQVKVLIWGRCGLILLNACSLSTHIKLYMNINSHLIANLRRKAYHELLITFSSSKSLLTPCINCRSKL